MKRTIFYSWQSDLPSNTNRSFIESCLKEAVDQLTITPGFSIEMNLDRDTKNIPGTPDILDSIFSKIAKCKIFVADVSIINTETEGRKCPNPNVLIELGYAARVLGWERVFCFFNTDYAKVEELPFDLRQRRPILYSLKNDPKAKVKKQLASIITNNVHQLFRSGRLFDVVDDYLKMKVDTEIIGVAVHLGRLLYGYTTPSPLELTTTLLKLSNEELTKALHLPDKLGFLAFKNFRIYEQKFRSLADTVISSIHHNREFAKPIIELMHFAGRFDSVNSPRELEDCFLPTGNMSNEYKIVPPSSLSPNPELPNRYIIGRKLDERHLQITDHGDFPYPFRIKNFLQLYTVNPKKLPVLISLYREFIDSANSWLELTNGEFILDTFHQFEFKTTAHDPNTV
ncbi:hypothetical protein SAMN05421788_11671 [Filimonas lacunae]|uniref:CD-NTase-associated protein 12/Pycsar effector protein TIR domain-containing protein n=1 Tax=Filimonas lacunae TaxID=477680 RepID=A0A173MGG7_9BACT|nr:hypothetical protein [Filimonas lacunae]BAV06722.1 hypothetical protein FLA_2742 [Filimonas lacunae]SIT34462.1 hypothetical protein SAMN05421788_11671 [Filimonas lacunae]